MLIAPLPEGPQLETIRRIVTNARRLGKDAFHASAALDLVAPIDGRTWTAICCSCLDRIAHDLPDTHVHRISMAIYTSAGGCMLCPYSGCDTLVAALECDTLSVVTK